MNEKEYVIWGIAPNTTEEQVLLSQVKTNDYPQIFIPITSKQQAEYFANLLKTKYNCTNIRIQTIDTGIELQNDWTSKNLLK